MAKPRTRCPAVLAAGFCLLLVPSLVNADNKVLGEIAFRPADKTAQTSGVWVDNKYIGYVAELKGNRKLLLVPGEHEISIRQSGYIDFNERVNVEPGTKIVMRVMMTKSPRAQLPDLTGEIKLKVTPERAAVILDGAFAGTVREFSGIGRAMLVNPGKHHLKIDMPGYLQFNADVDLLPHQTITIRAKLVPQPNVQADPTIGKK